MATYTEDFAGANANLTTPWIQWRSSGGGSTTEVRRNGSGVAQTTSTNVDHGAFYNNTIGNDQYSQIQPQFNGPGDGSKYIYLMLRGSNATDSYHDATSDAYWFWSDGGSDTLVAYFVNGPGAVNNLVVDNSFTFSSGNTIKFEVVGTDLKVYKNGTLFSGLNASDSHIASGFPGFGGWGSGPPTYDNWEGGDTGAAPAGQPTSKRHGGVPFMASPGRGNVWAPYRRLIWPGHRILKPA